jgi:AbrB family looped-hinge helix DNA binding protein
MIYTSVVTSKGQMTIPQEVRNLLGIEQGDVVTIKIQSRDEKKLVLEASGVENAINKLHGALGGEDVKYVPLDQVRKAVGKKLGDKYKAK